MIRKWLLVLLVLPFMGNAQAYKDGEFLKYKIHYFFFNAGYASIKLEKTTWQGKPVYHAYGKGRTSVFSSLVMDVDDIYESYFDEQNRPLRFIRHIREGNYHKFVELLFHHNKNMVQVIDKLNNTVQRFYVPTGIQDMLSAYYALRNIDTSKLKKGDYIKQDLFFDNEVYHFKMKILGRQILNTKFGKIRTLVLRPYVQSGRVFKEEESLTVWVSDDQNKIPLRIKAKLLVGSIKADLIEYKNLKYPLAIVK
ncbi:MAG: DUF3108 domain-containing protein [Chlorobi bacterium]|nr:DUF3108 domain-containing protein [Chlorobiota bacterium]